MSKKVHITASALLASSILLSGCGLFGGDEQVGTSENDIPQDENYVEDITKEDGNEEAAENGEDAKSTENVQRELYLIDSNGYVVSQTLELPKTDAPAKQALEYLVEGGPVEELLPNGFRAVLPAGTDVDVNLKEDGTIVADFSKEFIDYAPENEMKILQAITYTLTQFENVKRVQIQVNGYDQKEMPLNKTPIGDGVSRSNGINLDTTETLDLMNTRAVTLYFLSESSDGELYYVPVTKRLEIAKPNDYTAIINALISGPSYTSGLTHEFSNEIALVSEPKYENGNLTLDFNEALLGLEERVVSKTIVDSLVLTLTEQQGVETVSIMVNGEGDVTATDGTNISEPVARPEKVNTGRF